MWHAVNGPHGFGRVELCLTLSITQRELAVRGALRAKMDARESPHS